MLILRRILTVPFFLAGIIFYIALLLPWIFFLRYPVLAYRWLAGLEYNPAPLGLVEFISLCERMAGKPKQLLKETL